ncbi:MAG: class II SORL domain-containing protein [Candidatus Omnitrophica bacterium]|nr:class II SORL domain-containing protein [Candidatus Omnitrophota bacterium]MCM8809884.1 class II SORL domain-containing protein [Candidatus Omnitrophota bacterium]MCM8810589.1 class II SORL domain-containing protein [Candidatus Omnitrophota bacterium]MCM8832730.1 class II SORL domain-containing protein [Candidatus Omnitrophota bacterium]
MVKELYQSADWKKEKHVPVIEIVEKDKEKGVKIIVSVGKEIPHPNTTSHHISWIEVYFLPEGSKFPYQIGRFDFVSHGASVDGPDTSSVYSEPFIELKFKTGKKGKIFATSYCNIHGLWENSIELEI